MKKSISIFSLSLLFIIGLTFLPTEIVEAGGRHGHRRAKRAYVAGAVRSNRRGERRERKHDRRGERREYQHDRRNERHERRETRRSIATGAIAVGVGAAVIRNVRERRERY